MPVIGIALLILILSGIPSRAFAVGGLPTLHYAAGMDPSVAPFALNLSTRNSRPLPPIPVEEEVSPEGSLQDLSDAEELSEEDLEIETAVVEMQEIPSESSSSASELPGDFSLPTDETGQPGLILQTPASTSNRQALFTSLRADGVKLSRPNRLSGFGEDEDLVSKSFFPRMWERIKFKNWDGAAGYSRKISCPEFTGTHSGNKVYFRAEAIGGSGRYTHSLIYTLNASFESPESSGKQFEFSRKGNGIFRIQLPPLRDDVPYVQLTVLLLTRDLQNPSAVATDSITFLVARPVILSVSNTPEAKAMACYERFLPYPSTMGILSNGSKNRSTIEIQQVIENSWASTKGWQAGVFFSPLSFLPVGNLIFFNFSYFQQTTKKIVETVAVSTDFQLDPGEFMQIYTQPTRYITPYDGTLVAACGQTRKIDGAYLFQWWGYSYIPYPIQPEHPQLPPIENIGAPAVNTCPAELTPLVGDRAPGTYEFRSTM